MNIIRDKLISYLLMITAVPISGELKFYPFSGTDLRVSMGMPVFFFILLLSRRINLVFAGFLTGSAVVFFRVLLDRFSDASFQFHDVFLTNYPSFFYYLVFATFFQLFRVKKMYARPLSVGLLGIALEVISNSTEMLIRIYVARTSSLTDSNFLLIIVVAIIRSFFVLGFFNILVLRETRLAEEQQRKRTEQVLLIVSNLYVEKVQLEKSTKNAEELTGACYKLYRDLKGLNHQEQAGSMLKIAGELHEIKKDNQRIYAGLSKLMAKENLDDFMNIEDIIAVITHSNRNYGEMLGKTINYKVIITGEHPRYHTFILLSLINNLVANAVEAISQNGEIVLTVERLSDMVKISIHDNGSGISSRNKKYIFEPGFTTKFDQNGIASNGIGLSYIKNVIEHAGGEIKLVDSTPTEGTTFEILLPIASLTERGE